MDIAKRLLDYGFHAPTVYFPLVVPEAMMMEPTETESKETLDAFAATVRQIVKEDAEILHQAPHATPVSRPDEVGAARQPCSELDDGTHGVLVRSLHASMTSAITCHVIIDPEPGRGSLEHGVR